MGETWLLGEAGSAAGEVEEMGGKGEVVEAPESSRILPPDMIAVGVEMAI